MKGDELQDPIWRLLDRPMIGHIYRSVEGRERKTGGSVLIDRFDGDELLEVRNLGHELPPLARLWPGTSRPVEIARGDLNLDWEWERLDEQENDAFQVFRLLDPRVVMKQLTKVRVVAAGSTRAYSGVVDLRDWHPALPSDYLEWLGEHTVRPVELLFSADGLIEMRQPDLPPRQRDLIIERFNLSGELETPRSVVASLRRALRSSP